jgi:hypothetical protein
MNRLILALVFCWAAAVNAQTLPNFDLIKLEKASDYKAADPFVLQTANFLLSSPFTKDNAERTNSLRFISKWMHGTPDYSFVLNDMADKIGKDNNDLLGLYVAALAKFTLENKAVAKDPKLLKLNSVNLLLNYCENHDNNIKMSKQLKRLSEARQKGQLEQAL